MSEHLLDIRTYELIEPLHKDADTSMQLKLTPQLKEGENSKWEIASQDGNGHVHLDPKTHKIKEFVMRHQSIMIPFWGGEHSYKTEYSVKLR
jgi:hypothetical protein